MEKGTLGNSTAVSCQYSLGSNLIYSKGIFYGDDPFSFSAPLLMLQLSTFFIVFQATHFCLKPLRQSSAVSQIIAGIILGPSLLGHVKGIPSKLSSLINKDVIDVVAALGLMFFEFVIGVKMDPFMVKHSGRKAFFIGLLVYLIPLALNSLFVLILSRFLPMDQSLANSLPSIASAMSASAFVVIAVLLTELKILNTNLGRLAVSSAMISDIIGISMTAVSFSLTNNKGNIFGAVWGLVSCIGMVAFIVFLIRPAMLWLITKTPERNSVDEFHIISIFLAVLLSGFVSDTIGQQIILGPLILGLSVPDGPPLGEALVTKLDSFVCGIIFPTYLAASGMKINLSSIRLRASWILGVTVIFTVLVKFAAVMFSSLYFGFPLKEAFVLGLMFNAKGIVELTILNIFKDTGILNEEVFSIVVIAVIIVTAIIAPLLSTLYDPTERYMSSKRTTIQHAKYDEELRLLVCVHKEDNVPTIINLLEVSNATEVSPINVIVLQLTELRGRSTPILIPHQPQSTLLFSFSNTIINAFRQYELNKRGLVTIEPFMAVAHFATIHDDVCNIALNKSVNMVIIPFHRRWAIDGNVGSEIHAIRMLNQNILDKAPCSVGILVDRNVLNGTISVLGRQTSYRVAVLLIGGTDDGETLAYGVRIARHQHVSLTVIQLIAFSCDNAMDRKLHSDMVNEFKLNIVGNNHIRYRNEVVKDGEGLGTMIRGMSEDYDLLIVGRHQRKDSKFLSGLKEWIECPELGIVGDMLASAHFRGISSVLIVQQQATKSARYTNQSMHPVEDSRDVLINDV